MPDASPRARPGRAWVKYRVSPTKINPPAVLPHHGGDLVPEEVVGHGELAAPAPGRSGTGTCRRGVFDAEVGEDDDRHPYAQDLARHAGRHHRRTTPVETIQLHKTPRTNSMRMPTRAVGPMSSRNAAFFLVHGEDSPLPRAR